MSDAQPRYFVKVTTAGKLIRTELRTDDRGEGEDYCRTAVLDGCRSATLYLASNPGHVVTWWDREEVRRWQQRQS